MTWQASASGPAPRGASTRSLWIGLWVSLLLVAAAMIVDGVQRSVPLPVWVLWFLPLLILVPGMLRDRLRSFVWLSFVTLLYFVAAVQRIFAEPGSARAQLELAAVIVLFLCAMFYIRQRARELRGPATDSTEGS